MKYALVTGADRGFGHCLGIELLNKGYAVIFGRFLGEYDLVSPLSERYPGRVFSVQLDVEQEDSIRRAAAEVGQITDHLDVFVSNAAYMGGPASSSLRSDTEIDPALIEKSIKTNAVGALKCVEALKPLLDLGEEKRLCFVSSEVSSVNMMQRDGDFRYCISKTALNMAVRMLYNSLFDKGYTFRLYQPGWMRRVQPDGSKKTGDPRQIDPEYSAAQAVDLFTGKKPDEQRLELMDYMHAGWPF